MAGIRRTWTPEELKRLVEYRDANLDWESIGKAFDRNAATCQQKFYSLNRGDSSGLNPSSSAKKMDLETIGAMAQNRVNYIRKQIADLTEQIGELEAEERQLHKIIDVAND